jgi:hypothetical protein
MCVMIITIVLYFSQTEEKQGRNSAPGINQRPRMKNPKRGQMCDVHPKKLRENSKSHTFPHHNPSSIHHRSHLDIELEIITTVDQNRSQPD